MILTIYAKEYLRKLIILGSHQMSSDEVFGQWEPVVDVVLNVMGTVEHHVYTVVIYGGTNDL